MENTRSIPASPLTMTDLGVGPWQLNERHLSEAEVLAAWLTTFLAGHPIICITSDTATSFKSIDVTQSDVLPEGQVCSVVQEGQDAVLVIPLRRNPLRISLAAIRHGGHKLMNTVDALCNAVSIAEHYDAGSVVQTRHVTLVVIDLPKRVTFQEDAVRFQELTAETVGSFIQQFRAFTVNQSFRRIEVRPTGIDDYPHCRLVKVGIVNTNHDLGDQIAYWLNDVTPELIRLTVSFQFSNASAASALEPPEPASQLDLDWLEAAGQHNRVANTRAEFASNATIFCVRCVKVAAPYEWLDLYLIKST